MPPITHPDLTCKELVELVTDYLEGTLPPANRARFEQHLASCDGCQVYMEQMRQTIRTLCHLPQESISSRAMEELLRHFRRGV